MFGFILQVRDVVSSSILCSGVGRVLLQHLLLFAAPTAPLELRDSSGGAALPGRLNYAPELRHARVTLALAYIISGDTLYVWLGHWSQGKLPVVYM